MSENEKDKKIAELTAEINTLKSVISKMPGTLYWKNYDGVLLGCNDNMAKVFGLSTPDDVVGKTDLDLLDYEMALKVRKNDLAIMNNKTEKSLEEYGIDPNGNPAIYLTKKLPLFNMQGEIEGLAGISFDITDRKKIEEKLKLAKKKAEAASRAKTRFVATMSHELRTPLTSILGFASLIDQANLEGEKKKDYLKHIVNSSSYLLSLINSLLDFNKLETDKYEVVNMPLNLKDLIENVVSMLMGTAKLKGISLLSEYDTLAPEQVMSNGRVLRQILINLAGNAIKFTDHGYVAIRVKCMNDTAQAVTLQISVEDTGIGIPLSEQKSVFKQFYQLGSVYTRNSSLTGTGLGLAIVKKLVKLLGGKIYLKSAPNSGSRFYFTIKLTKSKPEDTPWLQYASTVNVLVTQDNPLHNNIHSLLSNTRYEVVTSSETINYMFSAQQSMQPVDIVILDHDLKGTKPSELEAAIKDQCELQQPLIVTLSSKDTVSAKENPFAIPKEPTAKDVREFQLALSNTWSTWQNNFTQTTQKVTSSKSPYVLLVEDNVLIQIVHKHLLEELGYRVDIADSAKSALDKMSNNYDLLLVDIGLPEVSGFDLIKIIRNELKEKTIPIIVITGYSEEEERQHCLRAGANEVASKPISKHNLEAILSRFITKA